MHETVDYVVHAFIWCSCAFYNKFGQLVVVKILAVLIWENAL